MKPTLKQFAIGTMLTLSTAAFVWAQGDAKEIYGAKCVTCHGADGAGKTAKGKKAKVLDVRTTVSKVSAAEMEKVVANGKGENMDGYSGQLTPAQIKGVVEYYRSLAK
ncbi:MAG: cytochrome c [Bryobacteraceae bacterium]